MGDRIRIGELLAAIGTIGLAVSLFALSWFDGDFEANTQAVGAPAYAALGTGSLGAGSLGWFAYGAVLVTLVSTALFFVRLLAGRGPERATLQAPVAYTFAAFTFLVLLVRVLVFQPGFSPDVLSSPRLPDGVDLNFATTDLRIAIGGYLGLLFLLLIVVGLWIAMSDDRAGSKAAKARTAALLSTVPVRSVPHVAAPADPDASVVADDAVPTDPTTSPHPASGGPA